MMAITDPTLASGKIVDAVQQLDTWFDTMRGADGYGGPVAHWWQNCLHFTGSGLDWRYEGIIIGYLNLYDKTGNDYWLAKARCAGDDLVHGQLPSGSFRNSTFELNPNTGGTPHEAACDLALLHLATVLKEQNDSAWETYYLTAKRNLHDFYIDRMWDTESFRDSPNIPSFVPNKAATLTEALLKLAELTGDDKLTEVYALPTLNAIIAHQAQTGNLQGAIYQNSLYGQMVPKFFPYYIARCVPALLQGFQWTHDERFLQAALDAMRFVVRQCYEDGSLPQVVYLKGRCNRYPQWIAATGDILRVARMLEAYGLEFNTEPTMEWLLAGRNPNGSLRTAHGFASQVSQHRPDDLPEFRDVLPVCGWNDKAFRYLTELVPIGEQVAHGIALEPFEQDCLLRGKRIQYSEDMQQIEYRQNQRSLYVWQKGSTWASINAPELLWK